MGKLNNPKQHCDTAKQSQYEIDVAGSKRKLKINSILYVENPKHYTNSKKTKSVDKIHEMKTE